MGRSDGRLSEKVAIVTGAGRGIGRAIALEFAAEGANVVVASRTPSTVESVVTEIEESGGVAIGLTVDVGERDQLERIVTSAPVAVFLASTDSDFVTGQAIHVDGGQILRP
jgi:NAD(P)-dependent dehydrogenase (short-subunit alcohol dehydrogenase family)